MNKFNVIVDLMVCKFVSELVVVSFDGDVIKCKVCIFVDLIM